MSEGWVDVLVGIVLLASIAGVIVPVLPGTLMAAVALVVWALVVGGTTAWVACAAALVVLLLGQVLKYVLPHRSLAQAGVPGRSIMAGGLVGVVGFFLLPVVGLPVGFVAGVMAAEGIRLRDGAAAWESTWVAMKATGFSMVIELGALILATLVWASAVGLDTFGGQLAANS